MLKITASHGRKAPGKQDYSTTSYHCSIEVELCDTDPEQALRRVHELWRQLEQAVDQKLEGSLGGQARTNGNGNGGTGNGHYQQRESQPVNSNGNGNRRPAPRHDTPGISPKQIKFARALGRKSRLSAAELDAHVRETFGDPSITLRDLTKKQASQLIEQMLAESGSAA